MEEPETQERRAFPRARGREPLRPGTRRLARVMFYGHLWLGVVTTAIVLVLSISGILLNHKRPLGLMPDVPHEPTGAFENAVSLDQLANAAAAAAPHAGAAGVDRMDVRPRDGIVKVRFRDDVVTEVTLDLNDASVLHIGERNDVFLEKLHSGEIFGDNWVLLSDLGAVGLIILVVSGYWLWLFPRTRQ